MGPLPALVEAAGENAQSRFIAQKILELREEGVPLSEMAVLFRSSFHSFDLEIALSRAGLPFIKRGGMKFIETAHVKDLLGAFARRGESLWIPSAGIVCSCWSKGVGPKKAQDLLAAIVKSDKPYQHPARGVRESREGAQGSGAHARESLRSGRFASG